MKGNFIEFLSFKVEMENLSNYYAYKLQAYYFKFCKISSKGKIKKEK